MKKFLLILLPLLIICAGAAFVFAQNNKNEELNMTLTDKKILVSYFSWSGKTKSIVFKSCEYGHSKLSEKRYIFFSILRRYGKSPGN